MTVSIMVGLASLAAASAIFGALVQSVFDHKRKNAELSRALLDSKVEVADLRESARREQTFHADEIKRAVAEAESRVCQNVQFAMSVAEQFGASKSKV